MFSRNTVKSWHYGTVGIRRQATKKDENGEIFIDSSEKKNYSFFSIGCRSGFKIIHFYSPMVMEIKDYCALSHDDISLF